MYLAIKFLHVVMACLAIGITTSYGLWFKLAQKNAAHYGFVLRGVTFLDTRVANPCFIGLGLSGAAMIHLGGWPWTMNWITGTLLIYCVLYVISLTVLSPAVKRQLEIFDTKGADDAEFVALSKRGQKIGPLMGLSVMFLIYLMVVKPG